MNIQFNIFTIVYIGKRFKYIGVLCYNVFSGEYRLKENGRDKTYYRIRHGWKYR